VDAQASAAAQQSACTPTPGAQLSAGPHVVPLEDQEQRALLADRRRALPHPQHPSPPPSSGPANYTLDKVTWDNQLYASGPWPHTRLHVPLPWRLDDGPEQGERARVGKRLPLRTPLPPALRAAAVPCGGSGPHGHPGRRSRGQRDAGATSASTSRCGGRLGGRGGGLSEGGARSSPPHTPPTWPPSQTLGMLEVWAAPRRRQDRRGALQPLTGG